MIIIAGNDREHFKNSICAVLRDQGMTVAHKQRRKLRVSIMEKIDHLPMLICDVQSPLPQSLQGKTERLSPSTTYNSETIIPVCKAEDLAQFHEPPPVSAVQPAINLLSQSTTTQEERRIPAKRKNDIPNIVAALMQAVPNFPAPVHSYMSKEEY